MTFRSALRHVFLKNYFTVSGRATRAEFWYGFLGYAIIFVLTAGLLAWIGWNVEDTVEPPWPLIIPALLGMTLSLLMSFPMITLSIRRLHDRGHLGWWLPIAGAACFTPYVGFLSPVLFLFFMAQPGTDGTNKFGPDPRRGALDPDVFA